MFLYNGIEKQFIKNMKLKKLQSGSFEDLVIEDFVDQKL